MKHFDNSRHNKKLEKIICQVPFNEIQIFNQGDVGLCCYTWLPTFIGNVNTSTLLEMISNATAQNIKDSVGDGTFQYCSSDLCPKLSQYTNFDVCQRPLLRLEDKHQINHKSLHLYLNYDVSCNLYCGSCRNQRILYTKETAPASLIQIHNNVLTQINQLIEHGYDLTLNLTGSGDPFASPLYWDFLKNIALHSPLRLELSTNGTSMTRDRLLLPFGKRIKFIGVSVDAVTEETYNCVRRGGSYPALMTNLRDLDQMVVSRELPNIDAWQINFVVQASNFHEMADFARWALSFNSLSQIWYNLIADWGHLSKKEFEEKAVWKDSHPKHRDFLAILRDPVFSDPKISIGNMASYRKKALA